jgi:hypothetical protein
MTKKQTLIENLNNLKLAAGEPPVSDKWKKRAQTWTVEALIKIYEKEAAA